MCQLIEIESQYLSQENACLQDEKIEQVLKGIAIVGCISIGFVFLFPILSNAQISAIKDLPINEFIEYDGVKVRKLFKTIDYRQKKVLKNIVQEIANDNTIMNSIQANIEINPFGGVLDLTPILEKLFSFTNKQNSVKIIELEPQQKLVLLNQVMYSFQQLKNYYLGNNKLILLTGGFLGVGFNEIQIAKKGFDFVKKFLDKKEREKEVETKRQNNNLGSLLAFTNLFTNPFVAVPIIMVIVLKGRIPAPKTPKDYDELPEPLKPLFKKPSKQQRFIEYYVKPIYNFRSPIPYVIVGGIIIYFSKGKLIAFFGNTDQYRSAFGEITSIMMNQLKNQFSEFVNFVKSTNSIFVEQLKTMQREASENFKETKQTLKENLGEQKVNLKQKEEELKTCQSNKEKITLGYQECSLRYQYARDYFEQYLVENNNSNNVDSISDGIQENAKKQTERILPGLKQDVTEINIMDVDNKNKKKNL
jgi:hypothetical protein